MSGGLDELIGTTYGPFPFVVTPSRVAAFATAIGDDPGRWMVEAPPMFANVALFTVAPLFLTRQDVVPFTRSLLHTEQEYAWARRLGVGEVVQVTGRVRSVRARGALNLVTFELAATSDAGAWVQGKSVFVLSQEQASATAEEIEPPEDERPPFDDPPDPIPLPGEGERLAEVRCGASRTDLMRYAAASEDWNPIHFDHDAARRAGLGGVIVHGLLLAAWIARSASRYGSLEQMRVRFRRPLRPATPAVVSGVVARTGGERADLDLELAAQGERLVSARVQVTP